MIGRGSLPTMVALLASVCAFAPPTQAQGEARPAQFGPPSPAPAETLPSGPALTPGQYPPQDRNGTLLWGYPLLDPPPTPPGWFAALNVDVVGPAIKQRVLGQVTLGAG